MHLHVVQATDMVKPKGDPARALKWTQRGDDWCRLAEHAHVDHVATTCRQFAAWAYGMAELWGGMAT